MPPEAGIQAPSFSADVAGNFPALPFQRDVSLGLRPVTPTALCSVCLPTVSSTEWVVPCPLLTAVLSPEQQGDLRDPIWVENSLHSEWWGSGLSTT